MKRVGHLGPPLSPLAVIHGETGHFPVSRIPEEVPVSFAVVGEAGTERNGEDPESKAGITEW